MANIIPLATVLPDFSSLSLYYEGQLFTGIDEFSSKQTNEIGKVRGTGQRLRGRTRGQYDCEGSFSIHLDEWKRLRTIMGPGYMNKQFSIVEVKTINGEPSTKTIAGARIMDVDESHASGTDVLKAKISFHSLAIVDDGISAV